MCGRHALLPTAMKILVCYDRMGSALYRGGFAGVWKGEYRGQNVAIKVIRTYTNSDLQKVIGVGTGCVSQTINELTEPCVEVLQGGCDMEDPSASKCAATDRCDDD